MKKNSELFLETKIKYGLIQNKRDIESIVSVKITLYYRSNKRQMATHMWIILDDEIQHLRNQIEGLSCHLPSHAD